MNGLEKGILAEIGLARVSVHPIEKGCYIDELVSGIDKVEIEDIFLFTFLFGHKLIMNFLG